MPRRSATTSSSASRIDAGALIVIEIDTRSSGMLSNSNSISSIESIATPTLPPSPRARGSSESIPICVGRSKAPDSPVLPRSGRSRWLLFDSAAVEKPAYCRIVHNLPWYIERCGPRVNGKLPGSPRSFTASNLRAVRSSASKKSFSSLIRGNHSGRNPAARIIHPLFPQPSNHERQRQSQNDASRRSAPVAQPRAENRHALRPQQGHGEEDLFSQRPRDLLRLE